MLQIVENTSLKVKSHLAITKRVRDGMCSSVSWKLWREKLCLLTGEPARWLMVSVFVEAFQRAADRNTVTGIGIV